MNLRRAVSGRLPADVPGPPRLAVADGCAAPEAREHATRRAVEVAPGGRLAARRAAEGHTAEVGASRRGAPVGRPGVIRVLIANDHPIVREGLSALINRQADMVIVAEAADGLEAVDLFVRHEPQIALLDLRMPGLDGAEAAAAIRSHDPFARVVVLTSHAGDEDIYRCLRAGAKGYLLKAASREDLLECLRAVHAGRTSIAPELAAKLAGRVGTSDLTAREREVLRLIAKGRGNREIGLDLQVTEGTVKVHVNNILTKLGVGCRTEAVTLAFRRGIVRLDD